MSCSYFQLAHHFPHNHFLSVPCSIVFCFSPLCLCALECLLISISALHIRMEGVKVQDYSSTWLAYLKHWWAVCVPFFCVDDHLDGPECLGHVMVVIQLGPESALKPSWCRLAKEKHRVGDRLSARAFPASLRPAITWGELTRQNGHELTSNLYPWGPKPSIKSPDVFSKKTIKTNTTTIVCPVKRPAFISGIYLVAGS